MPKDQAFLDGLVVRPIGRDVDVTGFEGNEVIKWYLCNAACDHHEKQITTVHCFLHGNDLAGYVTTSMTYVDLQASPLRVLYRLTEIVLRRGGGHHKKFPGLLIGMLGVCTHYQRRGLGAHMVKYAIGHARQASNSVACRFVAVDSDETVEAIGMYSGLHFTAPPDQKRDGHTVRMLYDLGPRA
jgi:GNAT superfamily N-acetyltransferase